MAHITLPRPLVDKSYWIYCILQLFARLETSRAVCQIVGGLQSTRQRYYVWLYLRGFKSTLDI